MPDNYAGRPYAEWLESVVRNIFEADPECIALEMLCADGSIYTCYYNVTADDRARFIGGMQDDDRMDFIRNNRDLISEILSSPDDDDDNDDGEWPGGDAQ